MIDYPDYWIFTIQMSRWRYARDLNIPIIDITAKSGIETFAPAWDNLKLYKQGQMSDWEYSLRYYSKVIPTTDSKSSDWSLLKKNKTFALACYCKPGEFCHRHLFSVLAATYLQSLGNRVVQMGELVPHPDNLHYYFKQTTSESSNE